MHLSVQNERCSVVFNKELRERESSTEFGALKVALWGSTPFREVSIDFTATEWADPLSLLALAAVLATASTPQCRTTIELGSPTSRSEHRVFLKFLARQGFLAVFSKCARFRWNSKLFEQSEFTLLHTKLSEEVLPTNYRNADCILAKIVSVNDFSDDTDGNQLHAFVESLIAEASDRLIDNAYGRDPLSRDRLLQKIRKILFELLSNAIEHSYTDDICHAQPASGYAGVYARMRSGRPTNPEEVVEWEWCRNAERSVSGAPGIRSFQPNPLSPWIELFVADVGTGLLSKLNEWTAPNESKEVRSVLNRLQHRSTENPLQTLSRILFKEPFSRVQQRSSQRTSVTGLVHLGLMLQQDRDYARIYTAGEWAGVKSRAIVTP